MKKANKYNLLRHIKMVILTGMLLFLISCTAYFISLRTLGLINLTGLIDDRNRFLIYLAILFICFILAGALVDSLIRHIITKKQKNLIDAMQKVTNGDFAARITSSSKLTDTSAVATAAFNSMAERIQESHEIHKDFMGSLTHEIKTPLGNINGFAKVIKNSAISDDDKNEYLDIIIEESERLSHLSSNILLLSRIENQQFLPDAHRYNITEQIRQLAASFYSVLQARQLELFFVGDECFFFGNRELMSQVWINLLDNAIKFSPEGGRITVETKKIADTLKISISNHSQGISKDRIYKIFDKFYTESRIHENKGNGLGLAIVRDIIALHAGRIFAEISEDGLFTITVELPENIEK